MKKITKRNILNLITILIISSLLMGCSSKTNSPNYVASSSQEDYSSLLEEATTVKIKEKFMPPISKEHFFIITEICDECAGLKKIKCIAICPMDAIKRK